MADAFAPSPGETIIFCDFYAKPVAEASVSSGTVFTAEGARFGFQLSNGAGLLELYRGNGTGGGEWFPTTFSIPLSSKNQAASWVRLTARLDFTKHTWDFYANGKMIAADVQFLSNASTYFSSFQVQGDASAASFIDKIGIEATNPLFADVNNDGIDDAWETKYGLSLSTNDRYLNLSGDGVPIIQDFINGTSPFINTKVTPPPVQTGMVLDLRSDAGVVTDSNGNVTQWLDQSPLGNTATPNTASGPHLAAAKINGLPALAFNGTQSLSLPQNMMQNDTAGEVIGVVQVGSNPNQFNMLWNFGTYLGSSYLNNLHFDDFGSSDSGAISENPSEIANFFIYDTSIDATGTAVFRYNGFPEWTRTGLTVGFQQNPDIGGWGSGLFIGNIAEVIVFNRTLTDAERSSMGAYLLSKYAFPAIAAPAAPTDLLAAVLSSDKVDLSWTVPSPPMHTVTTILRKTGAGGFVQVAQVNDALGYTDTGLSPGTAYTYEITVQGYAGTSGVSNPSTVTTPAAVADLPQNGLALWLRSTVGTEGSGALSTWVDQSGNGNNATPVNPATPPLVVENQANGLPVVRFNGPNALNLPQNMLQSAQAGQIIAIVKIPNVPNESNTLWNFGTGNGTSYNSYGGSAHFDDFGSSDTSAVQENPNEIAQYYVYDASIDTSGNFIYRFNGSPEWTRPLAPGVTLGFQQYPDIGGYGGGSLMGDIAEIVIYNRVLSDSELATVYGYLGNKYGLASVVANVSTPVISVQSAVAGQVNAAFSYQIRSSGSPTSYSASPLPPGLTLNTSTGLITGTPTAGGSTTVSLGATNFVGTGTATLTINVDAPPTVTLSSPADGSAYFAPASLALTASASSSTSTVASVAFYQGQALVGTVTGAGPTYTFTPSSPFAVGTYVFTAVATDALGLSATSASATVTVNPVPTPTPVPTPSPTPSPSPTPTPTPISGPTPTPTSGPTPTPTQSYTASLEILMPANGCTETYARPSLAAHYSGTTPVYPDSFHVYLDGRDYTASATIQTGEMMFMPLFNLSQGSHNYRVDWVYGGAVVATDNTTFTVNSAIPGGGTHFQGQVAATTGEPLVNVRVLAAGQTVYTDVNGKFSFTNLPVGITLFHFQTDAVSNPGNYTPVNLAFEVLENQNTLWDRPVYLVKFDPSQGVMVQSNSPVPQTVTNPTLPGVQLVIPANTAIKFPDGGTNEVVTIINVPVDQAPNCLGPGFRPSRLVSIQPENTTLSQPAQLTLPNDFNLPNGTPMRLANLDVASGKFIVTGTGTVTNNAFVTDPGSGVTTFDWFQPQQPQPAPPQQNQINTDNSQKDAPTVNTCSYISPSEGALEEDHSIPAYMSLGVKRSATLHYNSRTAAPDSSTTMAITPNAGTAALTGGTLTVSSSSQFGEGASYVGLANQTSPFLATVQVGLAGAPSGMVPVTYGITTSAVFSTPGALSIASVTQNITGKTAVINGAQLYPALGIGWSYADVDKLVFQSDGSISLIGGAQSSVEQFTPSGADNILNGNLGFERGTLDGFVVSTNEGPPPDASVPPNKRHERIAVPGMPSGPTAKFGGPTTPTATVIPNLGSISPTEGSFMAMLASPSGIGGGSVGLSLVIPSLPAGTERIAIDADVLSSIYDANVLNGTGQENNSSIFSISFSNGPNYFVRTSSTDNYATVLPGGDTGYAWRTGFRTYYVDLPSSAWNKPITLTIGASNDNLQNGSCAALVDNIRFEMAAQPGATTYAGPPEDHSTFTFNTTSNQYVRVFKDGSKEVFDQAGREIQALDRFGNTTTYSYTDGAGTGSANDLASIKDPAGLVTQLAYQGGKLASITDPASRVTLLSYNGSGQLQHITNADGTTRSFGYDGSGRMISQTDGLGQTRQYAYGPTGRLVQVVRADGAVYKYTAANVGGSPASGGASFLAAANPVPVASGQTSSTFLETDPNGHTTTMVMDADGDTTETIDALGHTTTMVYDDERNRLSLTLPNGCQYAFSYDRMGNLLTKTSLFNNALTSFQYTSSFNLVQSITDPLNRKTSFTYDGSGNLTQITDPAGGTVVMTYNPAGQVLSRTDQRGKVWSTSYDSLGRVATSSDPLGGTTSFGYDNAGNVISLTDPRGNTTSFQYDAADYLVSRTAADGGVTRFAYDYDKDLVKETDPLGNIQSWTYNPRQWPVSFTDGAGSTTKSAYDGVGNLISFTDMGGNIWSYTYDALNRRSMATDPAGNATSWTYDAAGNTTALKRADGSTFTWNYDILSRQVAAVAPDGATTSYAYDLANQRTSIQDALNGTVKLGYDLLGRKNSSTDQLGRVTKWTYDGVGNLILVTRPDTTTTSYAYDGANRRVGATNADGGTSTYSYDPSGNLISLTDSNGATRQFAYDPVNRQTTETDPLGFSRVKAFDLAGNLSSLTRKDGAVIAYSYDADNRLVKKVLPAIGGVPSDQVTLAYDARSNLVSPANGAVQITNAYDVDSNISQTTQVYAGNGATLSYAYDSLLRRVQMTDSLGTTEYAYDSRDRLTNLTDPSGSAFAFGYDLLSRTGITSYPNGVTTTRAFDAASQLSSIAHSGVASAAYTYNSVGP